MGTVGLKALGQRREIGNEQMDLNLDSLLCYGIRSREGTPVPNLASDMTKHRTKQRHDEWPEDDESVGFEEISEPILKAIRFAYRLVRRNKTKDIPWSGLDLGQHEKATCSRPIKRLTVDGLAFSLDDQGRDALEEIVGLAIQLGIEQGRRMERTRQNEWRVLQR